MTAALVAVVFSGAACTDRALADSKRGASTALDNAVVGADKALADTKRGASTALDAAKVGATATGEVMSDGWITTKVKAKFVDETMLRGSDISVDTTEHAVTLRGMVLSWAAKGRAVEIAKGTEGVTSVVDQLFVK